MHIGNACGASLVSPTALGGVTSKSGAVAIVGGVESSQLAEVLDARVASSTTAIIPGDPGAALILQQAESSLLTEESMYALLQQDSLASPLSFHWNLPPSNLIKSALGRAAWLRNQVQRWQQVPLSELQACLQYILSLLPQEVITSENQRLWQMQPSVVLTFYRARVAAQLPYTSVFRSKAKVYAAGDRIVWEFDAQGMPGPALAPTTASTSHYRWYHCGADLTLIGLFTSGRMLRTCSETVGMQPEEAPYAFFGRAGFDGAPRDNAKKEVAELQSHSKNRTGVIVSGRLCTSHHKMMGASTYWETLQCREHELVRSSSSDKRWAIRASSAAVDKFYLVCVQPSLEVRVPTWSQFSHVCGHQTLTVCAVHFGSRLDFSAESQQVSVSLPQPCPGCNKSDAVSMPW